MGKTFILDRLEENFAIIENTETLELKSIAIADLPKQAKPGDALFFLEGKWCVDEGETARRKESIKDMFERIKARNS